MLEKLFNIEAEQGVLGAILYDAKCADMASQLKPSDFSAAEHAEIFAWIQRDIEQGKRPSVVSILPALAKMKIGSVGGASYLVRLGEAPGRANPREALASVKEFAGRRALSEIGSALLEYAANPEVTPRETSLEAVKALNDALATSGRKVREGQSAYDAVRELVQSLDGPDDGTLISTGLKTLDAFMGGWPRGELSLVAGRPSMGKSAVMSAIARRGARSGLNIMFFSLEMPRKTVSARWLSDFVYSVDEDLRIPYADILRRRINERQKYRLAWAMEQFLEYGIEIHDQRGLTMPEIQFRAMRHAEELDRKGKRLDVVMVDHIGKIKASDRYKGSMTHETGEKSDQLMTMAYELDVALVAAHQLNRNTEGREDKHPTQGDLRDSGNLEQDANTLIFPYRQSYYLERQKWDDPEKDKIRIATLEKKKNIMEIIVAKCRNGAAGTLEVFVDMASNHVEDLIRHADR